MISVRTMADTNFTTAKPVLNLSSCEVKQPDLIGNGKCDNYDKYNTLQCGYDGGDCLEFNSKYPFCEARDPSLLGNGVCENIQPYYSERCGWDENDCNKIVSIWIILIGIAYIALPLALLESRRRLRGNNGIENEPAPCSASSELREQRREQILTNIIHKKIKSEITKKEAEESQGKEKQNVCTHQTDEENPQTAINFIRNSKNFFIDLDEFSEFSPLSCPICYEEFKKDDYISLSQNDECHHIYHVDCILQWLLDNDECPMCRLNYLVPSSPDSESSTERDLSSESGLPNTTLETSTPESETPTNALELPSYIRELVSPRTGSDLSIDETGMELSVITARTTTSLPSQTEHQLSTGDAEPSVEERDASEVFALSASSDLSQNESELEPRRKQTTLFEMVDP